MAASDRQRRLRARQRSGEVVVPVIASPSMIETLIELRWLSEGESEDRKCVGDAIRLCLDDVAKHVKKP